MKKEEIADSDQDCFLFLTGEFEVHAVFRLFVVLISVVLSNFLPNQLQPKKQRESS